MPDDHSTEECWQPIEGWEGLYDVSCRGRVLSHHHGRLLRPFRGGSGYLQIRLCDGPRRRRPYIHQLVTRAFIGEAPTGCEPNHRNGNKFDNSVANLEWMTHSDNLKHAWATGLYSVPRSQMRRKAG